MISRRFVVDTNAIVSRLILPESIPAKAVRAIVDRNRLLFSEETLAELVEVLGRPKFDRYVSREDRQQFLFKLNTIYEVVHVLRPGRACRDPKDDKFLDVALNGSADAIITGDSDLLSLNPFHSIPIISPAAFLGGTFF